MADEVLAAFGGAVRDVRRAAGRGSRIGSGEGACRATPARLDRAAWVNPPSKESSGPGQRKSASCIGDRDVKLGPDPAGEAVRAGLGIGRQIAAMEAGVAI